ncbi:hypothetical protein ANCCAN_27226, partial [Ancylostoma caninum]
MPRLPLPRAIHHSLTFLLPQYLFSDVTFVYHQAFGALYNCFIRIIQHISYSVFAEATIAAKIRGHWLAFGDDRYGGNPTQSIFLSHLFQQRQRTSELEEANFAVEQRFSEGKVFVDERLRPSKYLIVPSSTGCRKLNMTVIVVTKVDDFDARDRWRVEYKWRSPREMHGFKLVFPVGVTDNSTVLPRLQQEAMKHGDILQGDYEDTYRNLTLKHLSVLRYVSAVCSPLKAVVKMDVDVNWNLVATASYIKSFPRNKCLLSCFKLVCLLVVGKPYREDAPF